MKKKYIVILLSVLLLALVLLWPHSFPELTAGKEITIKRDTPLAIVGEDGRTRPDMDTQVFTSTAYSTRTLVQTIMDCYYFRFCPLRTLLANGALEGDSTACLIQVIGNDVSMSTGGMGYVMVDNKIYHVGLFGNGANLALMEELSAVIANKPVSIS